MHWISPALCQAGRAAFAVSIGSIRSALHCPDLPLRQTFQLWGSLHSKEYWQSLYSYPFASWIRSQSQRWLCCSSLIEADVPWRRTWCLITITMWRGQKKAWPLQCHLTKSVFWVIKDPLVPRKNPNPSLLAKSQTIPSMVSGLDNSLFPYLKFWAAVLCPVQWLPRCLTKLMASRMGEAVYMDSELNYYMPLCDELSLLPANLRRKQVISWLPAPQRAREGASRGVGWYRVRWLHPFKGVGRATFWTSLTARAVHLSPSLLLKSVARALRQHSLVFYIRHEALGDIPWWIALSEVQVVSTEMYGPRLYGCWQHVNVGRQN